ncbi:MAG: DEAD/DEAH box helicase, partial [Flavobacteriales bacterium]
MNFEDLKLIEPILKALKHQNYIEPTEIQAKSIPLVLSGDDILGSAQTGTGKTAAFAIPIIQHLVKGEYNFQKNRKISSLIVTPTRELAIQIEENFKAYSKYTKLKTTVIFGGVSQHGQTRALSNGIDILVATPGRLLDLINQGFISINAVKYFVLDEADRMLDMGFIHDIKKIIAKLPKKRQSLFFSATMPQNILELSKQILVNPEKVAVNAISSAADTIQQ